jgi:hypothetical protein
MKKALKIILYTLLGILLLAITGSYISYNTYWAKDPVMEADSSNLSYYHETYNECRNAFISSTENVIADFDSAATGKIIVPGEADDDLSIDWCYIPAQKTKKKLLIINSGLHGIEGYTGSAIQKMFIEKILKQQLPEDMGVLLLHGLNPYGFKYHRKATENNVDLNRNCVQGDQMFDIKNEGYGELTDLLMPSEPVNLNNLHNRFFYLIAIYKIIKESMPVLRQAALQGQYDFDKGIYYGGKAYVPQIDSLKPFLTGKIKGYKTVLNVDLHTGYGERGTMHLFIDKPENEAVLKGVETIFEGTKIDWGGTTDFYTINGEYTSWANNLLPDVLCIPMTFEFGTLNTRKTFGSLKSMQIMIFENQGTHYGYKNKKNEVKAKHLFDEMYYPSSSVWRSKVIGDSYEMMSRMMKNFEKFESD